MTSTTSSSTPAVAPAEKPGLSAYVVLEQKEGGKWTFVANIAARTAEAAIRAHAAKVSDPSDGARVFVAISARSWQPVKVTPKVATTLTLEDVKA